MSKQTAKKRKRAKTKPQGRNSSAVTNVGKLLNKAVKLHQNGDTGGAQDIYRKILKHQPGNFDALQLLGAIELSRGRNRQALDLISRALAKQPNLPVLHCNLGIALMRLHKNLEAVESLQKALELDPKFSLAHFYLGKIFLTVNLSADALPHLETANKLRPSNIETVILLAQALCLEHGLDTALPVIEPPGFSSSEMAHIYRELGRKLRAAQQWQMALTVLEKAYVIDKNDEATVTNLTETLERMNKLEEADKFICSYLQRTSKPGMAINVLSTRIKRRLGKLDEARQFAQKELENADNTDASASMYNELGKILDKQQNYAEAWDAFSKSNQIMKTQAETSNISFDFAPDLIQRCLKVCSAKTVDSAPPIGDERTDINIAFFCGFPRSGTTLMEQILSRHPQVTITNEIPALSETAEKMGELLGAALRYPEDVNKLDNAQLKQLREVYLNRLGIEPQDKNNITVDKMPLNIWYLPLALRLFPHAKVLLALRNPLDACLSCFIQDFELNPAMVHFLDIGTTAKIYRGTMDLWKCCKTFLQPDYLEYRYEDLVNAPQETVDKITTFFGIDLVENLSEPAPEDINRVVLTPSYEAVAKPINASAVQRWLHYEKQLEPVRIELEDALLQLGYV